MAGAEGGAPETMQREFLGPLSQVARKPLVVLQPRRMSSVLALCIFQIRAVVAMSSMFAARE